MRQGLFDQVLIGCSSSFTIALLSVLATTASINQPSYANGNKFFCAKEKDVPVTKIRTSRGNQSFIRWVVTDFKGYPPQKRCQLVSAKFQRYYDNGRFYITSRDNFEGYPVLCISNQKGGSCLRENVLVTLKPGTDTGRVLRQILDFRRGAGDGIVELSGSQYVSYVDGDLYLDVKQLVDTEDSNKRN